MDNFNTNFSMFKSTENEYKDYTADPLSMYQQGDIQVPWDDELDEEDDDSFEANRRYMKSLYPEISKRIQTLVDEECDKLEYEGSIMYDDYPSKDSIEKMVDKIFNIVEKDFHTTIPAENIQTQETTVKTQQIVYPIGLRDNIQVILLNELFGRRRRRFPRRHRYSYPPFINYRPYPYMPYQPYVPYGYRYF